MSEALLTTPQVAKLLQVDDETVRRLAARGELPCLRFGVQIVRFHPEALRRRFGLSHYAQDASEPAEVGSVVFREPDAAGA